jgi:hypothetical protein
MTYVFCGLSRFLDIKSWVSKKVKKVKKVKVSRHGGACGRGGIAPTHT